MANKNELVERPRSITEAVFELNQSEMDIVDICTAMVCADSDIDDNLIYKITVKDYANYFGLDFKKNVYKKMKTATQGIHRKVFTLFKDDKQIEYSWIQRAVYTSADIEIMLGSDFKKMLVELKRNGGSRAIYSLKYSLPMKSQYSKRIYYMLKQWDRVGKRFDNLDELIKKLCIPKSYDYFKIKERIFNKAIEEINQYSDIRVSYKETLERKRGRPKVVGITWFIEQKQIASEEKKSIEKKKAKKPKTKNKFNDFQQNDYDFDEIEKILLKN